MITQRSGKKKQLKSIELNYRKSPFFDEVFPILEKLLNRNYLYLVDINIESVMMMLDYLGIKRKIVKSSENDIKGEKTDRLIDICKKFNAEVYLSGQGAKEYLEEEKFVKNDIRLEYQNFKLERYPQMFGEFIPNLSIVDMFFNCGKEKSLELLSK